MKIIINAFLIVLISFGNTNSKKTTLKSGWYLVTDNALLAAVKLDKSDKKYRLEKDVFIAVNNILTVELSTAYYNNKTHDILNLTFNKEASTKLSNLTSRGAEPRELGFVLNGKLIQVSKFYGQFSGNKLSLSGSFTKTDLQEMKKKVESEMKKK